MGAVDGVNAIIAGVQKVREVAQKIHDAELQNVVADLLFNVADLKMAIVELRDEKMQLRAEIEGLKRSQDWRAKLVCQRGRYFLKDANDPIEGYGEGPFCPTCLDGEGLLVSMVGPMANFSICGRCKTGKQ